MTSPGSDILFVAAVNAPLSQT